MVGAHTSFPHLESWTYDKLLGISLESSADVILADMGAAQGHRMIPWFRDFYRVMQKSGLDLRWTALWAWWTPTSPPPGP